MCSRALKIKDFERLTKERDKAFSHMCEILRKIVGSSYYKVHCGINSGGANSIYYLNVLQIISEENKNIKIPLNLNWFFKEILNTKTNKEKINILLKNILVENIKVLNNKIESFVLEDFFIFPLINTKHLKKWKITGYIYTLEMQDPIRRTGYDEEWVMINFPKTYYYLNTFKQILKERSVYGKYLKETEPFFTMFNIERDTFSPYKVIWCSMGCSIDAVVVSKVRDPYLGNKFVLPQEALAFIPTKNEDEAHYICAILNSSIINLVLQSLFRRTKNFGTIKFIKNHLNLKKFDSNNQIHRRLSELSKQCHELANISDKEELTKVEAKTNLLVTQIYGLTDDELEDLVKYKMFI